MTSPRDNLEELMHRAFEMREAGADAVDDDVEPVPVPRELSDNLLRRADRQSGSTLAKRVVRAAEKRGVTLESLVDDAGANTKSTRRFLTHGRDTRRIPHESMARLLWRSGLGLAEWQVLLRQALVSSLQERSRVISSPVWGRTSGLSASEREEALTRQASVADPDGLQGEADQYLTDVLEAWTTLKAGESSNP